MMRFGHLFRQLAERETRTAIVFEASPDNGYLPADEYGFDELYCTERHCDCRRVMLNVLAENGRRHVATINHAFEPPAKDDPVPEQTFLDPLNRQSELAPALLDLFVNVVLADPEYRQRLVRHYHLFKRVVEDPSHPDHHLTQMGSKPAIEEELNRLAEEVSRRRSPIPPPPPRRGRKKWK
jgi:hypothetical protein